jgi:photosystem II stability/assembly factor-like uncharacterized protein
MFFGKGLVAVALVLLGWCRIDAAGLPAETYTWRNVAIGGGGFVTGIIPHPAQKGLMYARTDVGGAYRRDDTAQRWIPITDGIGESDFTGIESLALDPVDTNCVYLAAGIYRHTRAAIFRSRDQGRTWLRTEVPFKMGGNEAGRANGERLAVDPNDGNVLFFGSRHDGLWKSADRAATWRKVEGFPDIRAPENEPASPDAARPRFGYVAQPVGIVCVLFEPSSGQPGHPSTTLYAAVSTTETNLYRSTDAGATWQAVPGQPVGLRPNHLVRAADGLFYLSYGKEPGPNAMTDGAVWKYDPAKEIWTDITPLKPAKADQPFGYGAVVVDAQHPSVIMAATFCHWKPLDEIFRSTNGGASWTPLLGKAGWDSSAAPYTRSRKPHWIGDLEIDPFNSDRVLFVTGYGIWCCTNATAADTGRPTAWVFSDRGLEETVPLALVSPADGAHLLSGVGDIDGFRHEDLDQSPAGGEFVGPRFSNTEDLAVAGQRPEIVVRSGTGSQVPIHAAISTDSGKSWNLLGGEPPNSRGGGTITISADGKTIVWTPWRCAPHFSRDRGKTWTACAGLAAGVRVVADAVNPQQFYAYDPQVGRLHVSTNAAVSFALGDAAFRPEDGTVGRFGFGGARNAALFVAPGVAGDVWLASLANGLWHSTNGGTTFTRMESVTEAQSLGFGKAAPGRDYPALFLSGKIGQASGLFRSDDAGATWVRINDDEHQYGAINHVTGDPRVFGRVYFATGGRGIIYGDPVTVVAKP